MAYQEPPKDTKTAVLAMWNILQGTNGSGLVTRFDRLEEKTLYITENMMTKEDFESLKKKRRSRWLAVKDVILVGVGVGGFLVALLTGMGVIG